MVNCRAYRIREFFLHGYRAYGDTSYVVLYIAKLYLKVFSFKTVDTLKKRKRPLKESFIYL